VTQPNTAVSTRVGRTEGGKYKLVRLLGEGGMGAVYEAQHMVVGRRFAIKFLHPDLAGNDEIVARFQREAQAAGGLENENIAAVVDAGTADDGAPYLVMEYLEGEDLAHLLFRTGPLPVPRAAYVMIQACRGLVAAHGRKIVHRDLKPENLFVCKRNDGSDLVKVLDFGIAKLHGGSSGTGLTHTGATMGTPFYMSLEQARGAKEVDHRTDIYALGVILYEILSGTKPHPGESYNEILYHVISNEPAPLDAVREGLPAGLATVVHKAMAREPSDRYDSVVEFMEALIPFAGRAVTPLRTSLGATVPTPKSLPGVSKTAKLEAPEIPVAVLPPETPEIPDDIPARNHSRGFLFGGLAAVGVVLVAVVMWATLGRKTQPQVAPPTSVTAPIAAPPVATPPPPALPPPTAVAPTADEIKSPPRRPPERPPGQRQPRRQAAVVAPPVAAKSAKPLVPEAQPAESQEISPTPRKKLVRSIDRQNPFAE
jgi:eukaryotic-like serine/threonine-protein kinase